MELREGMEVRMSNVGKSRYRDDGSNPHHLVGKITTIRVDEEYEGLPVRVRWSNGQTNTYHKTHLEPAYLLSGLKVEDFL